MGRKAKIVQSDFAGRYRITVELDRESVQNLNELLSKLTVAGRKAGIGQIVRRAIKHYYATGDWYENWYLKNILEKKPDV